MKDNDNSVVTNSYQKLLSIVITGRDDDYMLDFKYRITTTINHIALNLHRLGRLDEIEIVVVDWGSEVPLGKVLALTDEACQVCRFIYVSPEVVKTIQDGKSSFHTTKTYNTGIRRANGEFILIFAGDTLIPKYSMEAICRMLDRELDLPFKIDQTFFLCDRVHAPWEFVKSQPSLDEWDRFLLTAPKLFSQTTPQSFFLGMSSGALMMHESIWNRFRGLYEQIGGWGGSDIELMSRVSQEYGWLSLSAIGVTLCHMGHSPGGRRANISEVMERSDLCFSVSSNPINNDEFWGLANYSLQIQSAQSHTVCINKDIPNSSVSEPLGISKISIEKVTAQFADRVLYERVESVLGLVEKPWIVPEPLELAILYFISWYTTNYSPQRYLDFGKGLSYSVAAAALHNRALEIYYCEELDGPASNKGPYRIAADLGAVGHQGYARYINGDPTSTIDRLANSFLGDFLLDLITLRGDIFRKDALLHLEKLCCILNRDGAIVYSRSKVADFREDWHTIRSMFPNFTFIQSSGAPVGIILAAVPVAKEDGFSQSPDSSSFTVDLGSLRIQSYKIACKQFSKMLASPSRYPHYFVRIGNKLYQGAQSLMRREKESV